jgi:hypothetical protein
MTACNEFLFLKRGYESALREVELYESGGAASLQQVQQYQGETKAVSVAASKYLAAHIDGCPVCRANAGQREGKSMGSR